MITNDNKGTYLVKNGQKHDNVIYERPLKSQDNVFYQREIAPSPPPPKF